jgi:hypothetical protein
MQRVVGRSTHTLPVPQEGGLAVGEQPATCIAKVGDPGTGVLPVHVGALTMVGFPWIAEVIAFTGPWQTVVNSSTVDPPPQPASSSVIAAMAGQIPVGPMHKQPPQLGGTIPVPPLIVGVDQAGSLQSAWLAPVVSAMGPIHPLGTATHFAGLVHPPPLELLLEELLLEDMVLLVERLLEDMLLEEVLAPPMPVVLAPPVPVVAELLLVAWEDVVVPPAPVPA